MKKLFPFILLFTLFSCYEKPDIYHPNSSETEEKKFEMYEMSEMSLLMEKMYEDNELLKDKILKGEEIGSLPAYFFKIHNSKMTDQKEMDDFFKTNAAIFIKEQALIYENPQQAKEHFNKAVEACINCHKVKCGGPIPRIKKLLIN